MDYKKLAGSVVCGIAAGALAMAPVQAQDNVVVADTNMAASMNPMPLGGQVVRYYTDRAGYVTAMDVQTTEGVRLVRFSPDLGQRLFTTYPVGGKVDVFVMGSPETRYDVVGIGPAVPRAGYMQRYMVSDVDLLQADAYIMAGAEEMTVKGNLANVVTSDKGEVLALVLDDNTLIRVPRESRHIAPGYNGTDRVTPLFKGARVIAKGYAEAPRFGVLSAYPQRIAGKSIVVNGHSVGAIGLPQLVVGKRDAIFKTNVMGPDTSADELRAVSYGYQTYPGTMSSSSNMMGTMSNQ